MQLAPAQIKLAHNAATGCPQNSSYRPDIDGLRGFGAFLVIWFHFRETWSDSPYKGADLTNSTFFAVSGFVITLSVLRSRERNPFPITLKSTAGFALVFFSPTLAASRDGAAVCDSRDRNSVLPRTITQCALALPDQDGQILYNRGCQHLLRHAG